MIRVSDDYYIDVDPLSYTAKVDLHKTTTDKKGNEVNCNKIIGYYSTLRGAVRAIVAYEVKSKLSEIETPLNEAIRLVNEASDRLEDLLNNISEEVC